MANLINLSNTTPAAPIGSQNVKWQSDASSPTNVSAYIPNPAVGFGSYIISISGATISATNSATGVVDYSGTDASVVINSVIGNMPNGGTILVKNGVYNLNSLTLETTGGFTNYYAIGIPGGGSTLYQSWQIIGESFTPVIDLFSGSTIQTDGVVFNVTATAISSVVAGSVIMGIWARPDIVNGVGPTIFMKNLTVRFPTNQRGNETAIDVSQALMTDYEYVTADFNIAWNNITVPVAGTQGLYGITTTASSKEENYMKNVFAMGYNVGLDIQGEHTVLINSFAINCNHAIDYGVRGGALGHGGSWLNSGWADCIRGLTMGANCTAGGTLNLIGLDIEDADSSIFPTFSPLYHALETNAGHCSGLITYEIAASGVAVFTNPPWLFDGGGGTNFMIASDGGWTSSAPLSVTGTTVAGPSGNSIQLATDNFTRGAENPLSDGGKWTEQTGSAGTLQTTGTLVEAVTINTLSVYYWSNISSWPNNQYSEMTVSTLTGSSNNLIPAVRMDTATNSGYFLLVGGGGAVEIAKYTSGTQTPLATVTGITITAGDVFRISAIGPNIVAFHNGVAIMTVSDATYASGTVGISIFAGVLANARSSLWAGGTYQALTFGATTATSANAGGNGDVPAQVVGYLVWTLNGNTVKIPYYAV